MDTLKDWISWYEKYKKEARCLDIEMTGRNGTITLIGIYQPAEGRIECTTLIKGSTLTQEALTQALAGCKLLITFNGISSDVPVIRKEFPNAIPSDIKHLDLYLLAQKLNLNTNLKVLERTFGIERTEAVQDKERFASATWTKYQKYKNEEDLNLLIEYNRQDTINLYPLAEKLIQKAKELLSTRK